mmetsp:Transcript_18969/g.43579  ORF Transcript_18969/g.43579 Transcript_18969/m.43579 type:complete len:270 (-) Transcript_18969:1044-1853(-)
MPMMSFLGSQRQEPRLVLGNSSIESFDAAMDAKLGLFPRDGPGVVDGLSSLCHLSPSNASAFSRPIPCFGNASSCGFSSLITARKGLSSHDASKHQLQHHWDKGEASRYWMHSATGMSNVSTHECPSLLSTTGNCAYFSAWSSQAHTKGWNKKGYRVWAPIQLIGVLERGTTRNTSSNMGTASNVTLASRLMKYSWWSSSHSAPTRPANVSPASQHPYHPRPSGSGAPENNARAPTTIQHRITTMGAVGLDGVIAFWKCSKGMAYPMAK